MAARRRPGSGRARPGKAVLGEKEARLVAADLLSLKAWSTRELVQRLGRRGAPPEIARSVVADLQSRGYLDDEAFARWWAQVRAGSRRIGSARLRQELAAKGIPRDLAAAAIGEAFDKAPELDGAFEAGRRRLPALRRAAPERVATRLASHLLRRGYPPSIVRTVVKRLIGADLSEGDPEGV